MQEGGRWCRTGSYFCSEVAAGSGVVVAAAGKWSSVQEGSCWCRLKELDLKRAVRLRGW